MYAALMPCFVVDVASGVQRRHALHLLDTTQDTAFLVSLPLQHHTLNQLHQILKTLGVHPRPQQTNSMIIILQTVMCF